MYQVVLPAYNEQHGVSPRDKLSGLYHKISDKHFDRILKLQELEDEQELDAIQKDKEAEEKQKQEEAELRKEDEERQKRIKDASVPVGGKKMRADDAEFLIQETMKQPAAHATNFKKAMATGDRCDGAPPVDAMKAYWSTCSIRFEQQARVADQAQGDLKRVKNDLKGTDVPDKDRAMLQADAEKLDKKIEDRPKFGVYADKRNRKLKKMDREVAKNELADAKAALKAAGLKSSGNRVEVMARHKRLEEGTELETDLIKRKAPPKKSPAKKTAAKKKRRTKEDEEEDEEDEEEESEEEAEEEKEAAEEKEEEEAAEEEDEEAEVGKFLGHNWVGTQKGMELQYDLQWASGFTKAYG